MKLEALKVYGYDNKNSIINIVTNGYGAMPAFAEHFSPNGEIIKARLDSSEIEHVADFVIDTATKNEW